jgi:hypothetical protein
MYVILCTHDNFIGLPVGKCLPFIYQEFKSVLFFINTNEHVQSLFKVNCVHYTLQHCWRFYKGLTALEYLHYKAKRNALCNKNIIVPHERDSLEMDFQTFRFSTVLQNFRWSSELKLHGLSSRANYTDRATAACRRSDSQLFADRGCHVVSVTDPYGRILRFIDRSRYFSIK